MQIPWKSFVAVGDSFTEGVGDELPDGSVRGWADMVAWGLAAASTEPITYANLAIRGRLAAPIIGAQLDAAIALHPALLSLNAGGNDILRPRVSIPALADSIGLAVERAVAGGAHVLLATGGNPSGHMPLGSLVQWRGEQLAQAVRMRLPKDGVTLVDNWADAELGRREYWAADKIHLNRRGHRRAAANALTALGVPLPELRFAAIDDETVADVPALGRVEYWQEHVLPWVGRRLRGRSSGDGRAPKIATLQPVSLPRADSADGSPRS
ncbi:lysophospholipase L1-like esterase [Homoserinimonas aerilata]|uniref:Lysophospholipase L1-like esterase n=1 Tax=Homoserinimonas aerilata TaxID=1162970 RepID=A0A542YJF2_9MICO|nr:SGNH/GDSL hydrolase family protein [Homoserinimonas aerilata]TQL48200.1 lysophospholipase L1-like esterase [Homoserinimonas aerilata]